MNMQARGSLLVVDDEPEMVTLVGQALRAEGHDVQETSNALDARRHLDDRPFDVIVLDYLMPAMTGLDLMREIANTMALVDRPQVLMMTGHPSVESAIEAMKLGAVDYLQKPFRMEALLARVHHALEHQRLRSQRQYLMTERNGEFNHYGIIGRSRAMQNVIERAELVAQTKSTVLIAGETGTGKEMVARAIHHRSAQRDMPLVKVNCAAIPEALLESELFGHVRGAFTGATTSRRGRFALADGGTIFLDEIGTMTFALQAKLLRVLQEREFEPLGSERAVRIDVRVIAASNRNLQQMVSEGKFQDDLYYRLNVIPIEIPPLRERREDIAVLIDHFVEKHRTRLGKQIERISENVIPVLEQYDWPGNVRELENTIERAVVLATDTELTLRSMSMLGATSTAPSSLPSLCLRQNLEWAQRETMRQALERARGVKKDAAALMGISQRAVTYYVGKWLAK
jgi:two-component system response regulator AtoC